ncbi:hypothetical protein [Neisseria flavescens]|nr:hypothetical protein [Neisseria flavescens]
MGQTFVCLFSDGIGSKQTGNLPLHGFLQSKGRLKKFQTAFNPSING